MARFQNGADDDTGTVPLSRIQQGAKLLVSFLPGEGERARKRKEAAGEFVTGAALLVDSFADDLIDLDE